MIQKQLKYKNALMLCAAINGNESASIHCGKADLEYAKEYIKYLKNEKCDWFSVKMFMSYYANKYQIEDMDAVVTSMSCYKYLDRKGAKKAIKLLEGQKVWDVETIQRIKITINNSKPNKHHKKVLKYINKIRSEKNIKKNGYFQQLILQGYCDHPHIKNEISIIDFLK